MAAFSALPDWVDRLGWVLIHFVWQGAIAGVAAWLACHFLRGASARTRYTVLCAALAVCGLAPLLTWVLLGPSAHFSGASTFAAVPQAGSNVVVPAPPPSGPLTTAPLIRPPAGAQESAWPAAVEGALPDLVIVWGIGVTILTIRLTHAWFNLRRMRGAGQPVEDRHWTARFGTLAREMGVARVIAFLECAQVDVPTVAGWFRPVLLVPVQFLASLPPEQVEAILAHEVAHVRRHDYLVNLAQILVETLLFYHPAIWWLGSALRRERENCCDDLAVRAIGNRLTYARALAALEEGRSALPSLALAATDGTLLDRVRRVLGQAPVRNARQAWFAPLVLAAVAVSALGASLYSMAGPAPDEMQDPLGRWI